MYSFLKTDSEGKKEEIAAIRAAANRFSFNLSALTDEEIETALNNTAKNIQTLAQIRFTYMPSSTKDPEETKIQMILLAIANFKNSLPLKKQTTLDIAYGQALNELTSVNNQSKYKTLLDLNEDDISLLIQYVKRKHIDLSREDELVSLSEIISELQPEGFIHFDNTEEASTFNPPTQFNKTVKEKYGNNQQLYNQVCYDAVRNGVHFIDKHFMQMKFQPSSINEIFLNYYRLLASIRKKLAIESYSDNIDRLGTIRWPSIYPPERFSLTIAFNPEYSRISKKIEASLSEAWKLFNNEKKEVYAYQESQLFQKKIQVDEIEGLDDLILKEAIKVFMKGISPPPDLKDSVDISTLTIKINNEWIPTSTYIKMNDKIIILHTSPKNLAKLMEHISGLWYQALKDPTNLTEKVAEIHYKLIHAFPVENGTASIADIITKTIYKHHGFKLVSTKETNIDWEILGEPDMKKFIQEYPTYFTLTPCSQKDNIPSKDLPSIQDLSDSLIKAINPDLMPSLEKPSSEKGRTLTTVNHPAKK